MPQYTANPQASVIKEMKRLIRSADPEDREMMRQLGEDILSMKALSPATVHTNGVLSNISVMYKNPEYIGLKLMPVVTMSEMGGIYYKYGKRDRLAAPDDAVGNRSSVNEITQTRTRATINPEPYALMDYLDDRTLRAQDPPLNEMVDLVGGVNDAIDFKEEKRIAAILTAAASYGSNTLALGVGDRWEEAGVPGGDPVGDIQDAMDELWDGFGPTRTVFWSGVKVLRTLERHPAILDLFKNVKAGLANPAMIAGYFGADDYIVGRARQDTANEGQTEAYSRIWGEDSFGILKVSTAPGIRSFGFGYTFRFGGKITTEWYDAAPGISGGYYAKVGVDEDHEIVAPDAGYLLRTVRS
jgi:hypothetical protein